MNTEKLRKLYLSFFQARQHSLIPSASLIPENDPTTLFTGSGMQPMVPYLLGEAHPMGTRVTDSQKCFRTQDINEVGDNRHTTFFEMLGNWSFGDYFKEEQIPWMFEFLIKELKLDPSRLYITVFRGNDTIGIPKDTSSVALWKKAFFSVGIDAKDIDFAEEKGMQDGRIFYYNETKNWWSRSGVPKNMPTGEPGGPDTEMFWDFGEQWKLHEISSFKDRVCHINCDCGRFVEIGNNVFMQYKKTANGFEELKNKNVDFGGGLERIAVALLDEPDIFKIDLFDNAREVLEDLSQKKYGASADETKAFRLVLDHIRASVFLIADGALPSNKDQGYFTRRLIRRAIRFGKLLGGNGLCSKVGEAFIETYCEAYPELEQKKKIISDALLKEEEKFSKTLEKGLKEFEKRFETSKEISGEDAFILYSTYGFPLELTEELAEEHGQKVNKKTFKDEFKKHQEISRAGAENKFAGGLADHSENSTRLHTATHLLHQALRTILGQHVFQKGSNITPERLRFDFSHNEKLTAEQRGAVENLVNEHIQKNMSIHFEMLTVEEAKAKGAIGLFEDKYAQLGEKIKVYFIGDEKNGYFSSEICGGPHVKNTSELGHFRIKKEEASSAGVRRIKAVLD